MITRREEEREAARRQLASDFRRRLAGSLGIAEPESLPLAIVPAFNQPVTRSTRDRREQFRAFLIMLVAEAVEAGADSLLDDAPDPDGASNTLSVGGSACGTCRGYCCRHGGVTAFLDVAAIQNFLARNPGMQAEQVAQAYMAKLPRKTFQYSCVYHGESGCGLPREMRSTICNGYYCKGLTEFRSRFGDSQAGLMLIVASNGEKVERSRVVQVA